MRLIAVLILWLLGASGAWAQGAVYRPGPQTADNIEVELVAMNRWAAPGSTAVVALKQTLAPGWHTYWKNPGDSGGPTTLEWSLPPGFQAGAIVWPLPQRQRLMTLVNYGYEGLVLLPVPVEIPASARGSAPLKVEATLFVCSDEMCVPRTFRLALDLPVRDGAAPLTADGAAIQAVLQAAPRPADLSAAWARAGDRVTLDVFGAALGQGDPGAVWFYPDTAGRLDHEAAQGGRWVDGRLQLTLTPGADLSDDQSLSGVLLTGRGAFEITASPGGVAPLGAGARALTVAAEDAGAAGPVAAFGVADWLKALGLALAGGIVLNLMPCVFPILAMKAAALSRSAHDGAAARRDGGLFTLGVLVSFAVLAGVLLGLRAAGQAVGWGFQLQSPSVTAALAMALLAVALNLSGVYQMGAGAQAAGGGLLARAPRGLSAFLTGVLAVVVAAPCTGPFMAAALGAALVMPAPAAMGVFLALGLGLALPYLAVSLSPGLLTRLPRPGGWMERLRNLLAFPMYGAALWLAWVFARQAGGDALGLLLAGGLTAALALWLVGQGQAARVEGRRAVVHTTAAVAAAVLALALTATAARATRPQDGAVATGAVGARPWSEAAVAQARGEGRPVFIDFTADWCVSCKINEATALADGRVARAVRDTGTVWLVADWTRRDDVIAAELARHGRSGVPLYLVYPAGGGDPRSLPQLLTPGLVVQALETAAVRPPAAAGR